MLPHHHEILKFIARQRITTAPQVRARFGGTLAHTYVRLNVLRERGWLSHERVLHLHPGVYQATRAGLRVCGQPGVRRKIDLFSYEHNLDCTSLFMELEVEYGTGVVLSDRELRAREAHAEVPTFSVRRGPNGRRSFPDLVVQRGTERETLFVELVCAPQSDKRLDDRMSAYVLSRQVGGVRYYASTPEAERALRQSLARVEPPEGLIEIRSWRSPNRRGGKPGSAESGRGMAPDSGAGSVAPTRHFGRKSGGARTITKRDREIVRWLARQRMATAQHVHAHFGVSISTVYLRLNILHERGLVSHQRILHGEHGVFRVTANGLAFAGMPLRPWKIDLLTYEHDLELTSLCLELEQEFGAERIVTERELRNVEADAMRREYAIDVAHRRHFPDLAVERYDGERPLLVELERSPKDLWTMKQLLNGFIGAWHIAGVRYYACNPIVERRIESAIAAVGVPEGLIEVRRRPGPQVA